VAYRDSEREHVQEMTRTLRQKVLMTWWYLATGLIAIAAVRLALQDDWGGVFVTILIVVYLLVYPQIRKERWQRSFGS